MVLGHVADAGVAGAELGGCGIDADVADILCDADAGLLLERAAEVGVGNAELCGNCADIYGLVVALREQLERAQHQRTETAGLLALQRDGAAERVDLPLHGVFNRPERRLLRGSGIHRAARDGIDTTQHLTELRLRDAEGF